MLVMVVFFIAFRWIHLSTPLIRLFLLVLILLLMPTLNFLPVWFALSLLRFRLPSRLPMMFILWMVRSEERRVGKECRSRWSACRQRKQSDCRDDGLSMIQQHTGDGYGSVMQCEA